MSATPTTGAQKKKATTKATAIRDRRAAMISEPITGPITGPISETFPGPIAEPFEGYRFGLPRTYLRPCLLLLLAEGESHGYDLLEDVRAVGLVGADAGGLYRTLRAMERDEIVRSWWEPSGSGPARRTYEITDEGRRALQVAMDSLAETQRLLTQILLRYGRPLTERPS